MVRAFWRYWGLITILTAFVASTAVSAQTATNPANHSSPRFLVYFDEFSAFLSNESKTIIADAAKRARETGAHRIVVQARASATGTAETNKFLAQTRSSIVTDQLEADGVERTMIQQEPIGLTGSSDPSVYNRRVDIMIEP
jgi:outer membrane protein OmpA-like peptidoglycan-associated protein